MRMLSLSRRNVYFFLLLSYLIDDGTRIVETVTKYCRQFYCYNILLLELAFSRLIPPNENKYGDLCKFSTIKMYMHTILSSNK